nr:immunoglobulin heavy chain junction region [Macaca mulatta]
CARHGRPSMGNNWFDVW